MSISDTWVVRLRPAGPWRPGASGGGRERVDRVLHSDTLFSAVTIALHQLGLAEEWLEATARAPGIPALRFSSAFPFQGDTLYAPPPQSHWPPPASIKVRWKAARFVPLKVISTLLSGGTLNEDGWLVDGPSGCLVPSGRPRTEPGPYRITSRPFAAVDRLGGQSLPFTTACLEFGPKAGFWAAVRFSSPEAKDRWAGPVRAAFRLLADSGVGGERSRGWGRFEQPEVREGDQTALLGQVRPEEATEVAGWWLLSLFTPAAGDAVDWTRGNYSVVVRSGKVESRAAHGADKRWTRMIAEGSVVSAGAEPVGTALDVAPESGAGHPVYRAGWAFALPVPARTTT